MKVLAYLAFTLFSILIQFSVMDLIQGKLGLEAGKDLNLTSPKKKLSDILKEYNNKPHALFYNKLSDLKVRSVSNATEAETQVPITTTVYDLLMFDENATTTESAVTTEFSTTEVGQVENITELSIFGSKNITTPKPNILTKTKKKHEKCNCNFLYKLCDINCCCDDDCTEEELKLFTCTKAEKPKEEFFCSAYDKNPMQSSFGGLFCIAGSNLPEKRISNYNQYKHGDVGEILLKSLKWQNQKIEEPTVFTPRNYNFGDPIWLLRNGTISYIDVPSAKFNGYCGGRRRVKFLKDEHWKCDVMIQHLEMLNILKNIEETVVISVTDKFLNDSTLNCSSLHCANWTIRVCSEETCTNYNKTLHEPTCTEHVCTGLAHKIEYVFNYQEAKIINASINLHTQSYSPKMLIKQQVSVRFYLGQNATDESVVKLSGNPGYLNGLPLIVSFLKANHTEKFFNKSESALLHPENKQGLCVRSTKTHKVVKFGTIAKNKYRYNHMEISRNATAVCHEIHGNVSRLLSLDRNVFLSPLGNPAGLEDKDWLKVEVVVESHEPLYGEFRKGASELFCNNIITKVDFVFGSADVSEDPGEEMIKIFTARAVVSTTNMTFNVDDISLVLTFETMFIDVTKKPIYEYAGSPNLHIHLPKDFFFPFHSSCYKPRCYCVFLLLVLSYVIS